MNSEKVFMAKLRIENLHKSFGNNSVLRGVNLSVEPGEIYCILGKSGTGKSVVMKHLIGLIEPDEGKIYVDDVEFTGSGPEVRDSIIRKYGILFQGAALFDSMNIYDNIAFGLRRRKMDEEKIAGIVAEMLDQVGLPGMGNKWPSELSGGMQKRAGLARAIALKPEIMLYDEPTTGVDPITGGSVERLIVKMNRDFGITSIVITHDINSAFRIAHRISMLFDGRVIFTGTPDDFKNSPDPYVRQFAEGTVNGPINVI